VTGKFSAKGTTGVEFRKLEKVSVDTWISPTIQYTHDEVELMTTGSQMSNLKLSK